MGQTKQTVMVGGHAWQIITAPTAAQVGQIVEERGASGLIVVVHAGDVDLLTQVVRLGIAIVLDEVPTTDDLVGIERAVAAGEPYASPSLASALLRAARRLAAEAPPRLDLTAREREILELVARGESNRSVAASLFLSEFTVRNHLARVFRKLGVATRAEAAQAYRAERAASGDAPDGSPPVTKH